MTRKWLAIAGVVLLVVSLAGCVTESGYYDPYRSAGAGALGGAATGAAILLVEQNAHLALEVAHRAYILETGEIALNGQASELRRHPQVLAAYLGGA